MQIVQEVYFTDWIAQCVFRKSAQNIGMDHLPFACVEEESVLVRKLILASMFLGGKTGPSCAVDAVRCLSTCLLLQS